jgi:hypothetical protein
MLITTSRNATPRESFAEPISPERRSFKGRVGSVVSGGADVFATSAAVMEAFPQFIYPSVLDATGFERSAIMATLDELPLHHVGEIDTISMVESIASKNPGWVTHGTATDYGFTNHIKLSRTSLTTPLKIEDTLIHEVGHTTDYSFKPCHCAFCSGASGKGPYGQGPHVTDYAKTNEREDYAETYQEYHQRPENLKKINPEKYRDMEETNRPNFLQRLVDRKEFRETGKFIGEALGPNKPARQAIETARSAAGGLQILNGIGQWAGSASSGDPMQHVSGILGTISGAVMLSGFAPLVGVGVQAANQALSGSVKRGELWPEEVESTIALPVRPLESLLGKASKPIRAEHRPGKVLAVTAGGAVGGVAGSFIGPYLGVLAGYHIAGGLGGAIGLVAGGALGFLGGANLGGRLGAKIASLRD